MYLFNTHMEKNFFFTKGNKKAKNKGKIPSISPTSPQPKTLVPALLSLYIPTVLINEVTCASQLASHCSESFFIEVLLCEMCSHNTTNLRLSLLLIWFLLDPSQQGGEGRLYAPQQGHMLIHHEHRTGLIKTAL